MVLKRGFLSSRREEIIEDLYNQLRELETKYRKLYEGSPEMYRTINTDGLIIDCNQAYIDNLGYTTKSDVMGHSVFEHTADKSIEFMRQSFREWQLVGHVRNKEVWLKRRDGSTFPALVNATSLLDNEDHLVGSNTVITDLTEVYASREKLQAANEALKKAQEIRDDFIRVAAHDLRTPIQPILMAAEMARRNEAQRDLAIDIIVREARRLKQLANDLLDLSRIETGSVRYEMKNVPASDIINEIVEEAKLSVYDSNDPLLSGQGPSQQAPVAISSHCLHPEGLQLKIDRSKIVQALMNIVNNSIKFTRQGQISIESRLNENKEYEIKITDSGPGIPPEVLPRLFEKFATKSPDKKLIKDQGTGLGLFICKSIISAHGGTVSAMNSAPNNGATFVVRLPLALN
ncbi:MAG TPA: PAS domain-containing sensor histidine kinase [Nitrososphaera sp.]|nr:PAS domain-containing sensor histidine kinase [Nitrososphaera sp.]